MQDLKSNYVVSFEEIIKEMEKPKEVEHFMFNNSSPPSGRKS